MKKTSGALALRLLTAFVVLPLAALLVWVPRVEWALAATVTLLVGVGLYEYYGIVRKTGVMPETVGGIIAGALVTASGYSHRPVVTTLALCIAFVFLSTLHLIRGSHTVAGLAASVFGVVYVGWMPAYFLMLHGFNRTGPALVTILIAAIGLSDAGAFLGGSTIGKHKLAPKVSPNKTWEGAIAGLLITVLGMAVFYGLAKFVPDMGIPNWGLPHFLILGAILSVVGQIGDLVESFMKRSAGVKDSGSFFPGHGGVLDRCDGYLFASPVLYYIVIAVFGA